MILPRSDLFMINLLFTTFLVALTHASVDCRRIEGSYRIADGRGRSIGIQAQIEQTDCSIIVRFDGEAHAAIVEGERIVNEQYTGDIDGEGRILWSNGFYYVPSYMEDELFPAECLHPFALHCHETCSRCVPCANGEEHDWCDDCGSCEMCLDYVPCLDAIQHMPECLESEAFECLRECRECVHFGDCMEVQSMVDPLCLTPRAAECLDQCADCAPCATGEASDVDCDQCQHCSTCQDYASCLDQVKGFPEDMQKCVSSEAIECFIQCEECSDKMYCLDAFSTEEPSDPARDCNSCVLEFSASGGCDIWLRGDDPSGVIPPGCESCADEAAEFCGIPDESSRDD